MGLRHDSAGRGPLRVLLIVRLFHPWVGGTERHAHKLARMLIQQGAEVQVLTGWWFRGTPRSEALDGVPVFRHLTLWEFFGVKGLRKLGGYLYIVTLMWQMWRRREHYDVVHVHGLNYHAAAAVAVARRLGKPTIVKLANSGPASDILKMREDRQLALSRLMLPAALRSDRFVALNTQVTSELVAAGVPPERIVEMPNGVDLDGWRKSDFGLHQRPCLLAVGRLHPQKGLDTLLRAFAHLAQTWPGETPCLVLVGEGPVRAQLCELAGSLDIHRHVHFAGSQPDVTPYLVAADVFVLASRAEGLSNALLEALAAGMPVVVSDVAGNREVVSDGSNGLVVEGGDEASLAAALRRMLEDERLREKLGTEGRRVAEGRYSLAGVARAYRQLSLDAASAIRDRPAEDERAAASTHASREQP